MLKIRKDDEVVVIAGKCKKERGIVTKVLSNGRLLVQGVNMVKKHVKANPNLGTEGGIIEKEAPIHASNVAIFNPNTQKADRVGFRIEEKEEGGVKKLVKVRYFKSTKEEIGK